ncbi:MAG: undecaprenyl/decaprenyl-phosphate alpha-N-acetylglucosaminyl 1-phosphate transferase, partial [bacterium]|nr:undecaprenyl/decaprenyl-phosphate alpha-N-acetylglucosaminyl 1-phosphate transferase [bacterium]
MWKYTYLGFFIISFLLSLILTPLFGKIALKIGIIDLPSERKIHKKPTPLLGGLGIFFSFFLPIILGIVFVKFNIVPNFLKDYISGISSVLPKLYNILFVGIIVIIYGILDDLYVLKALPKLFLQIIISTIIFLSGIRITFFINNLIISYVITSGWLILMMNSFNLLDNMDGLSAGIAFLTGFILFTFAFEMEQLFIATILSVFLGSILGFLFYNFPPAKLFMGECGSSFIGYFLGVVSILLTYYKYEE